MGKASKRKGQRRQGIGPSRADIELRRGLQTMAAAMRPMLEDMELSKDRAERAKRYWRGWTAQEPAAIPQWAEDSVGDRFFSAKWLADAARAPVLADAKLPEPAVLAGDPGHWDAAVSALLRGVVLDAVPVDDPLVAEILSMLAPVVDEELAQDEDDAWTFREEMHAPLFLVGGYALIDGAWAILGLDPVDRVIALLESRVRDALAEAGFTGGTDARVVAETLVTALTSGYKFEEAGDVETLERLGRRTSGNGLVDLIRAGQVASADALRLGLVLLVALADLARTDDKSVLAAAAS